LHWFGLQPIGDSREAKVASTSVFQYFELYVIFYR